MIEKRGNGAGAKVLLVEDNEAHAAIIMRGLEQQPYPCDIFYARDGEDALAFLEHRAPYNDPSLHPRPHVVLLDIRMPRLDGIAVLRALKNNPKLRHIPVIVLSTSRAEQDVARAYQNHANSYLVKPGDFEAFMALMSEFSRYWLNHNLPRYGK